jgi:simple sugar transport system permease protein
VDDLLVATLRLAAPLLIAALGELLVERAGVLNIGVEGMMLTGAFAAFAVAVASGSPSAGVAAGALAGCALGAVFAFFAVLRRTDQIVVGTAVNLLAAGGTGALVRGLYGGATPIAPTFAAFAPTLAGVPVLGPVFFAQPVSVLGSLLLAVSIALFLSQSRAGLRLRAVGESARAADTEGIPVVTVRVAVVLVGASLAGAAGAALPLVQSNTFTEGMTAGRGFIALAIVIFGRWRPAGLVLAALFFGLASAAQFRLQARGIALPYPVLLMLPYVVTLLVLTLAAGRARAPADLGRPYRREGA